MARTKISEFSATPGNNTDIDGINIAEGCAPSGINDAIRELMAQLKDFQAGTAGDSFNGPVGTTTAAAGAFTTLSASSTVTLSGGTANGVAYLNGSKVLTTGSALTFDGTNLGIGTSSPSVRLQTNATINTAYSASNTLAGGVIAYIKNASATNSTDATIRLEATGSASVAVTSISAVHTGDGASALTFGTRTNAASDVTEKMRLDNVGNLGLGVTPSAWTSAGFIDFIGNGFIGNSTSISSNTALFGHNAYFSSTGWRYKTSFGAGHYQIQGGAHYWYTAPSGTAGNAITFTQAMTLDASGRLLVGTTSASGGIGAGGLDVYDRIAVGTGTSGTPGLHCRDSTGTGLFFGTNVIGFSTGSTERARITSGGDLLVGTSGNTSISSVTACHAFVQTASNRWVAGFVAAQTTPWGIAVRYDSSPNNTTQDFIWCTDTVSQKFTVRSNGGVANYSGNNVNLSDRREKTNFAPAGDYLSKICAIPVQTFNYIDQNMEEDPGLTLGVVAQDVQAVAPELVMESNWGTEENPKMRLSIYQTDLQYALMKCIQEQQAIINQINAKVEAQAAEIAALKGQA